MKSILRVVWIICMFAVLCSLSGCRTETPVSEPADGQPVAPVPPAEASASARQIEMNDGTVLVREAREAQDGNELTRRRYTMVNGDIVTMGRAEIQTGSMVLEAWTVNGSCTLRYYDQSAAQWVEAPVSEQVVQAGMAELELEDGSAYLIYLPKTYIRRENDSLEYLPDQNGTLQIEQEDDHWLLTLNGTAPEEDTVCDYLMVSSDSPLIDWSHPTCRALWANYTMDGDGKWCYDGYYWPSPYNYIPTGTNYLYRCPASYLIRSFANAASVHRAAEDLAIAMLDTTSQLQNAYGFWPTTPQSQWLSDDYGIAAGFYDTRFNTDLIEIYIKVYTRYGGDLLRETLERYAGFYTSFAEANHFESVNGGWFVEDYFHPDGNLPTHCSLNHQAAECIALYHLSDVLEREDLAVLAGKLLLAIKDTAPNWINDNGDLHYCIFPNGSYGMQDYPYLTYNDLYNLQALLIDKTGEADADLTFLMTEKLMWMDANGVTGYTQ